MKMATQRGDKLAPELTWQLDGHVGEVVLTAMADGEQDIVGTDALHHVEECDDCMQRLGQTALVSLDATEALSGYEPAAEVKLAVARPGSRALPFPVIAAALAIAAAGAAPSLVEGLTGLPEAVAAFFRVLPVFLKSGIAFAQGAGDWFGGWAILFFWVSAGLLTITGLGVARALPRHQAVHGGM